MANQPFGADPVAPNYVCKISKPGDPEEKDDKFNVLIDGKVVEPGPGDVSPSMGYEFEVEVIATSGTAKVTAKVDTVNGEFSIMLEGLEAKDYKVKAIARLFHGGKTYPFPSGSQDIKLKEKSGPKVANQIEVDVRLKKKYDDRVEYDIIACPVDGKHKGIRGTIYAFPDDAECEIAGGPFVTEGKAPTIIPVIARGNTGLTLRMDGTDVSVDVLLDGPMQFHGKMWAALTGTMLVLTVLFFCTATAATFFQSIPASADGYSVISTETAKASIKWLWWWAAMGTSFFLALVFTSITAVMNTKTLVWKARKLNAERKYETKEEKTAKDGKEKVAAATHADGTPAWLSWFTAITNVLDLLHEKRR